MCFGTRKHNMARVSKDGAATDHGFTRNRHQMRASRVDPTCDVRDARTRLKMGIGLAGAAPHHEADRDPQAHQIDPDPFHGELLRLTIGHGRPK